MRVIVISDVTSIEAGDTALLSCLGYGMPDVNISWIYEGETVEDTALASVYQVDFTQSGNVYTQSILQLCSVERAKAGRYTCVVSNGLVTANAMSLLIVSGVTGEWLLTLLLQSVLLHVAHMI